MSTLKIIFWCMFALALIAFGAWYGMYHYPVCNIPGHTVWYCLRNVGG